MKQLPIIMPQLGESIAEATIVNFLVKPGDVVEADQDVIEVETNKATMNVSSPCGGKVISLTARLTESYPVGATLGHIEISDQEAQRLGLDHRGHAAAASGLQRLRRGPEGRRTGGQTRRGADRARPARSGARRGRQLHVAAHEGAHGGVGIARGRSGGRARQRRGGTRDDPGL